MPEDLEDLANQVNSYLPQGMDEIPALATGKKFKLPEGSMVDAFHSMRSLQIPFVGATLLNFQGMEEFMLAKNLGVAHFRSGPFQNP